MQGGVDSAAGALGKTGKRPSQFIALLSPHAMQKLSCRPSVTWSISLRRVDSLRAPEPRAHVFTPVPPSHAALDVDFHRESVELQMSVINPFLGGSVVQSVLKRSARQELRLASYRWLVALWGRPVNASIFIGHRLHPPHKHAMVAARGHTEGGSTSRDSGGAASRGSNGTPPLLIGATSFKDPRRTRSPTGSCESQLLPLAAHPLAARPRRPCRPGRLLCQPVTGLLV